jgi:hypothetical protein
VVRYLLMMCDDESAERSHPGHVAWLREMTDRGMLITGARLGPTATATTVQVRSGETVVSVGPFAEAKDPVGGFVLLDCADLGEAIAVAAKHPVAAHGRVEIRPLREG